MTLSIDMVDRHGLSNKVGHEFSPKEEQGNACISCLFYSKRCLTGCHVVSRHLKEDWLIVLQ